MVLQTLPHELTVCKARSAAEVDLSAGFFCLAQTADELSLVCRTEDTPAHTTAREDGWRAFRVAGTMAFSLTGVMAELSARLAERDIPLFAVSTYDTDYVLTKSVSFAKAMDVLEKAGYEIVS